jgi:hypothetical protein
LKNQFSTRNHKFHWNLRIVDVFTT